MAFPIVTVWNTGYQRSGFQRGPGDDNAWPNRCGRQAPAAHKLGKRHDFGFPGCLVSGDASMRLRSALGQLRLSRPLSRTSARGPKTEIVIAIRYGDTARRQRGDLVSPSLTASPQGDYAELDELGPRKRKMQWHERSRNASRAGRIKASPIGASRSANWLASAGRNFQTKPRRSTRLGAVARRRSRRSTWSGLFSRRRLQPHDMAEPGIWRTQK